MCDSNHKGKEAASANTLDVGLVGSDIHRASADVSICAGTGDGEVQEVASWT